MTASTATLFDKVAASAQATTAGLGELTAPADWPQPPRPEAYHELPGAIVEAIAPHTEADPAAILTQLLVACGAQIGRGAYFQIEATVHHPNQFCLLVGDSSKARKGSSLDCALAIMRQAIPDLHARIAAGLASGEGLVWAVRDPQGQDPGALDRRMLVIEPEFASVLKACSREASTLSPTLRCAWDGRPLQLLTRTAPARATDAHIAIIGHITTHELRRHASSIEIANGLLNRFLLCACRRVRLLPEGGQLETLQQSGLARVLAAALAQAATAGRVHFDSSARELWWQVYPRLSAPDDGLAGQLTARSEAHTIRLALLYTLLDGQRCIHEQHLKAALALWGYCQRSARWALAHATGDPLAEQLHTALARHPGGLTRTQLRDLCQRNLPAERIQQALSQLAAAGRATSRRTTTAGRPAELWTAVHPAT